MTPADIDTYSREKIQSSIPGLRIKPVRLISGPTVISANWISSENNQEAVNMNHKRFMLCAALVVLGCVIGSSAGEYQCQACTPGFFKNHPQFIDGYSCASFNQDTPV